MNLSRSTALLRFLDHLSKLTQSQIRGNKEPFITYILTEINRIYANQLNGYWSVTSSDQAYIKYLKRILFVLESDLPVYELTVIRNDAEQQCSNKLKVLFLASDISVWPSIESVYTAITSDDRFEVDMIDLPIKYDKQYTGDTNFYEDHKAAGHDIRHYKDYDLSVESPDVAIYNKPYGGGTIVPPQFYISDLRKVVNRAVLVPYAFFDLADNEFYIFNGYQFPLHYFAWKWVGYSEKFRENAKRRGFAGGRNVLISGHPKLDQIYHLKEYSAPVMDEYKKNIAGRKVLLYNSHHKMGVEPTDSGAFPEYHDALFTYFENHPDIVLLWRPHPFFFVTALGVMSQVQIDAVLVRVEAAENIILDRSENYLAAFALSDAMLTDGATSMAFEYAATEKPVYYLQKPYGGYVMPQDSVADLWYWIHNPEELVPYLEQFRMGLDPKKEYRDDNQEKHIGKVDGQCGERIKEAIYTDLIREEAEKVDRLFQQIQLENGDVPELFDMWYSDREAIGEAPPLLSALLLNYNNYSHIYSTIDSILMQDYPNIELIISDDCSDDGFDIAEIRAYVEKHKGNNIKRCCIIRNSYNMGTVKHQENLLQRSCGEYEMSIASDDIYAVSDVFSSLMYVAVHEHPGAEWVTSQVEMCDSSLERVLELLLPPDVVQMLQTENYSALQEKNIGKCSLPAAGTLHKKTFFSKVGQLSDRYVLIEDYSASVRALRMGIPVYYVNKVTVRHRDGGISHGNTAHQNAKYAQYVEDFLVIFEEEVYPYRKCYSAKAYQVALDFYKKCLKSYKQFNSHLPKAFRRNEGHPLRKDLRKSVK